MRTEVKAVDLPFGAISAQIKREGLKWYVEYGYASYKYGDIICIDNNNIAIFKEENELGLNTIYNTSGFDNENWNPTHCRMATEEQVQMLQEHLKEKGYMWNTVSKRMVNIGSTFKDGDFVTMTTKYRGKTKSIYAIFKEHPDNDKNQSEAYCFINLEDNLILPHKNGRLSFGHPDTDIKQSEVRISTLEEIKTLNEMLLKHGLKWDSNKKAIVRALWRAKNEGYYYYISDKDCIVLEIDCRASSDNARYESGNYFKSESLAKEYRNQKDNLTDRFWKQQLKK